MNTVEVTIIPPIQERVKKTNERLVADFSKNKRKIHRFPQGLRRWIGGEGERYIVPSFVALGPYHHGLDHLQKTEDLKHAAAHYLCHKFGRSVEEVYGTVLSTAGEARGCYDEDAVARFSEAEFAEMMFLDGCFLLLYVRSSEVSSALLMNQMVLSTGPCMLRDIMLLENQIPWLVLGSLMSTFSMSMQVAVQGFLEMIRNSLMLEGDIAREWPDDDISSSMPPHFLGLARSYLISCSHMPSVSDHQGDDDDIGQLGKKFSLASSAVELEEMGIKLTPSKEACFANMKLMIRSKKVPAPLFGELSLTPLFLNDFIACWLVNMAALEACTATWNEIGGHSTDGFVVSSYLSLMAMLMDKEEDVHKLRAKHIVHSFFSDEELLAFFKGLTRHLRLGAHYFGMIAKIQAYKRDRRVFIAVHKFFYHNLKIMVTLISIATVLVGLFKAILSLKKT